MMRSRLALLFLSVALSGVILLAGQAGPVVSTDGNVVMQVSPQVLVLREPGNWLTLHAQIKLTDVAVDTVRINGMVPEVVTADNRGELVVKIDLDRIKPLAEPPSITITLSGETKTGDAFGASQAIAVRLR